MAGRRLRLRYILGGPVQTKYLVLIFVSMLVPLVFVGGCLYYFILWVMAEQLGVPEYIAYNLFPAINKINMMLAYGIPPLFLLLLWWAIILSHRFAGPVLRLEKDLKGILENNDYAKRIKLRKNDDLKPLANLINRLLEKINGKHQ